jgi:hypothetical protein
MRFGLVMLRDGKEVGSGTDVRRLTFDPWGRTNNACVRLDGGDERVFGGGPVGHWEERAAKTWKEGKDEQEHEGVKSIWLWDDKKVQVTQFVEVVRGEQSRLLDTCRVRYLIENLDDKEHAVGVRFLLDTFIGGNDGVPFTIPGEKDLCDTSKEMKDDKVPDWIEALEYPDLAKPGTIAHLRLRLEGLEAPARVTLGAWPNNKLGVESLKALGPRTLWDVPLLSMKSLGLNDSAISIYWKEAPLAAGAKREVGFEYGLWNLSSKSARLAATADGVFRPGGQLTVVAYVKQTGAETEAETLTLSLPDGFQFLEGDQSQELPPPPKGTPPGNRPVTWKVKAGPKGKYELTVKSSRGESTTVAVEIRSPLFD